MSYSAFPTFPSSTSTSAKDLANIKCHDHFVIRGYHYKATGDACIREWVNYSNEKRISVFIRAVRKNGQMPTGWECADVSEHFKVEEFV